MQKAIEASRQAVRMGCRCILVLILACSTIPLSPRSALADDAESETLFPESFMVREGQLETVPDGWIGISTAEELRTISDGGCYILMEDIDLSAWGNWDPIAFQGAFDGNGHVVKNMVIDTAHADSLSQSSRLGLFSTLSSGSRIMNLGVENCQISVPANREVWSIGGIAGYAEGEASEGSAFSNCYATGSIASDYARTDGLVGTIPFVGGVCGRADLRGSAFDSCYNLVDIAVQGGLAGGVCGYIGSSPSATRVNRCANFALVSNEAGPAGGIAGYTESSYYEGTQTEECLNAGPVRGSGLAGGVFGHFGGNSTIANCFNAAKVTDSTAQSDGSTQSSAGGLAGENLLYTNCKNFYNVGDVIAEGGGGRADHVVPDCDNRSGLTQSGVYCSDAADLQGRPYKAVETLTDAEMRIADSFAGFDFENVWRMGSGTYGYPVLKFLPVGFERHLVAGGDPEKPDMGSATVYFHTTVGVDKDAPLYDGVDLKGQKWLDRELSLDWGDTLFHAPATNYEHRLARLGIALSMMEYAEGRFVNSEYSEVVPRVEGDKTWQSVYTEEDKAASYAFRTLRSMGFADEDIANYFYRDEQRANSYDTCAFTLAYKDIALADGSTVPLVMVLVRGTAANAEWVGNFNVSNEEKDDIGYHESFMKASGEIALALQDFLKGRNIDSSDVRYFLTGHSRGGSVANIQAAALSRTVGGENVYAYTFASPNGVSQDVMEGEDFDNIINIVNPEDLVTKAPLSKWGYARYGVSLCTPSKSNSSEYTRQYLPVMRQYFAQYSSNETYHPYFTGALASNAAVEAVFSLSPSIAGFYGRLYGLPGFNLIDKHQTDELEWTSFHAMLEAFMKLKFTGSENLTSADWAALVYCAAPAAIGIVKVVEAIGLHPIVSTAGGAVIGIAAVDIALNLADAHCGETYLAWMMTSDTVAMYKNRFKGIAVACPVDVHVRDSEGRLVASIEDDKVDESIMQDGLAATVDENGVKKVDIPDDDTYSVELVATGDGEMDYTISEYEGEGASLRHVQFRDVPLSEGERFEGVISEGEGNLASTFSIHSSYGETIEPDAEYGGGDVDNLTVTVEAQGQGNAWGNARVTKGSPVTVEAQPLGEAVFDGWYEHGSLVSESASYSFQVEDSRALVAKFKDAGQGLGEGPSESEGGEGDGRFSEGADESAGARGVSPSVARLASTRDDSAVNLAPACALLALLGWSIAIAIRRRLR